MKYILVNTNIYKVLFFFSLSSLWAVSMIPGDREVAGCFNFSSNLEGVF